MSTSWPMDIASTKELVLTQYHICLPLDYNAPSTTTLQITVTNNQKHPKTWSKHIVFVLVLEVANGDYGVFTVELTKTAIQTSEQWRNVKTLPDCKTKMICLDLWGVLTILIIVSTESTTERVINESSCKQEKEDTGQKALILVNPPTEFNKFKILIHRSFVQLNRDWVLDLPNKPESQIITNDLFSDCHTSKTVPALGCRDTIRSKISKYW